MQENYEKVASVGPPLLTPKSISRLQQGEEPWISDPPVLEEKGISLNHSSGFPDVDIKLEREEETEALDSKTSKENKPFPGAPSGFPEVPIKLEQEEEPWIQDYQGSEDKKTLSGMWHVKMEDSSLPESTRPMESSGASLKIAKENVSQCPKQDFTDNPSTNQVQQGKHYGRRMHRKSTANVAIKRPRRVIDLETKLNVIKDYESGKPVMVIARESGMSHSTIATILKNKNKVTRAIKGSTSLKATRLTKIREGPISDMERLLMTWMEDQTQNHVPLSSVMIMAKAKSLFAMLKEKAGPDYNVEFTASPGWLKRFKNRYSLHNGKVSGESVNADMKAAEEFVRTLDKLIVEKKYLPEQIFNMDETTLFWKRMPERTFIHKEAMTMPGFKAFKDRITVLLGGNVAGHKLKPFVIWHNENPRAFKHLSKHTLPVYYRSNKNAWMTQPLFQDALLNCYAREMEKYCLENNIPFQILLIVDNAPGHPPFIGDLHPNIKVVFLPPNTTSLIQPMDQGVVSAFKAYYLRRIFAQATAAIEEDPKKTLVQFWKDYTIYDCIKNLAWAWGDVTKECMNGIWKKTLKRFVHDFKAFAKDEEVGKIVTAVVEMANSLKLIVDEDDIEELLEVVPEELTNEELLELEQERIAEEKTREMETAGEGKGEPPGGKFTVQGLAEAFADLTKLLKKFENMDPNIERFSLIERSVHGALSAYKQIYDEKKRQAQQTTMDIFLKRVALPKKEPQAGPSGGIPEDDDDIAVFGEEGIAVIGEDGILRVVAAPEELPIGQDAEVDDSDTEETDDSDDPDPF